MAKPAPWYVNAARRTLVTAFPRLARPDDDWAVRRLQPDEARLFLRLPPQERAHGVEVARRLLAAAPQASRELVTAALLHDVGKLGSPQFVLWRVLAHLLPEPRVPAEPRLRGLAGARQARKHHAMYGAELVRRAGGSDVVADLVERHHDDAAPEVALLREADERT